MKITRKTLPSAWASALINNDWSGLDLGDNLELGNWIENNREYAHPVGVDDGYTGRFDGLLCDVADYVYLDEEE